MTTTGLKLNLQTLGKRAKPKSWRGWAALAGCALFILAVGAWGLSRTTPPWYQPLDANNDGVIDNSDRVQKRLLELHNVIGRVPLGEQHWEISQDEINSGLAIRFAGPLNPDGTRDQTDGGTGNASRSAVPPLSDPVVIFSPGKVTVSARMSKIPGGNPKGGVGTLVFSVGMVKGTDGQPMGQVKLISAWVGSLPVPKSLVEARLRSVAPAIAGVIGQAIQFQLNVQDASKVTPYVEEVLQAATEGKPFPLEYTMDRKHVIIKELRVNDGAFTTVLVPGTPGGAPVGASGTVLSQP